MDMAPRASVLHLTGVADVGDDDSAIAPGGSPNGDVQNGEFYTP
jgi:hypothetical protein